MKLMKYVGNASATDMTAEISFPSEKDRTSIALGGVGELSDNEIVSLTTIGLILTEVDDGGLGKMTMKELQAKAAKLGVELDDDDKKDDVVSTLRAHMASTPEEPVAVATGGTGVGASGGATGTSTGTTAT